MTNRTVSICEFIKNIIEEKEMSEEAIYNFMIVCGGNPSKNKFNSVARVVYVQLTDAKTKVVTNVMPDVLSELALEWVRITDNRTRKLRVRKTDFTVLGNTTEKEFSGNRFCEYSYGMLRGANIKAVNAIKDKYEIHDVIEFVCVEQTIEMPDME